MEKEGLSRSLALLESRGVNFDCIVTDRHPQMQKFLRERTITHYYNVWHMAKGILCLQIWNLIDVQSPLEHTTYIIFAPAFSCL